METFEAEDGTRLCYEIVGQGPPLVLHLGAGCDSGLWGAAGYLGALAEEYSCILFDHRGHGSSDHPGGADANHIDRYVADVLVLLEHTRHGRAAFWGYSNAVGVALRLADAHPDRLNCIVASGGMVAPPPPRDQLEAAVANAVEGYRATGWGKLIAGFESQEGDIPAWMLDRIRATDVEPVIGYSQARLDWGWSSWEALERVGTPTLFLVGELEDPDDVMAKAAARMPDGRRSRIAGGGHIKAFLDARAALEAALPFLRANTSTA